MNTTYPTKIFVVLLAIASAAGMRPAAHAATLSATYEFSGNFNADGSGSSAIVPVDPLGQSFFTTDTVFGQMDSVYRFIGNANPATEQSGLSLNTTGLVTANSYSAELVFSLDATGGYRRIIDVQDRQSDNGFYVDPSNHLDIFPTSGTGPNAFTAGFHHVIMTVAADGTVKGYIDGLTDFTTTTNVMNLTNSATNTLSLFLDNTASNAQNEYSTGEIAQFRIYDGVLTDQEALTLSQNPLAPEPSSLGFLALSLPLLLGSMRRRS